VTILVSNAKAESFANIIMWIGSTLAVLIAVLWYADNLRPTTVAVDYLESDLQNLQSVVNDACMSVAYSYKFNPRTEIGTLVVNVTKICINTDVLSGCREVFCNMSPVSTFDLANITNINIEKNDTVTIY